MRPCLPALPVLLLLLMAGGVVRSQGYGESTLGQVYLEPVLPEPEVPNTPRLSMVLEADIPLPGPLPGEGPRLVDQTIEIPVANALAVTDWVEGAQPQLRPARPTQATSADSVSWIEDPQGRFRYQARPEGRIVAQKRCKSCALGWKQVWSLRVGGSTLGTPLVTDQRIYFAALDNRVYSVKRKNGHRVWAVDIGHRISASLSLWRPTLDDARQLEGAPPALLLAVPDDGSELLALSLENGATAASFQVQNGDTLVGTPITTPDGRIVVARQRYAPTQASLLVLKIVGPIPEPAAEADPAGGETGLAPATS